MFLSIFFFKFLNYNYYHLQVDYVGFFLVLLNYFFIFFLWLAKNNLMKINYSMFLMLLGVMIFLLFWTFLVSDSLVFYVLFELSLLPIFFIIVGWGYQMERLPASFYLMLYTLLSSLPFLVILLKLNLSFYDFFLLGVELKLGYLLLFLPFMVKMPVYFFHLWLPKAHVEAPVLGSMVLAGVMLKIGGYGFIRFLRFFFSTLNLLVLVVLIWFSFMSFCVCFIQNDLKSFMAYSSVGHMSLSLISLLGGSSMGVAGFFFMMWSHGFSSSCLFLFSGYFYKNFNTRQVKLIRLSYVNLIVFSLFFFNIMSNLGVPPLFNFWAEYFILVELNSNFFQCFMSLFFVLIISSFYNIYFLSVMGIVRINLLLVSNGYIFNLLNFIFHMSFILLWFLFFPFCWVSLNKNLMLWLLSFSWQFFFVFSFLDSLEISLFSNEVFLFQLMFNLTADKMFFVFCLVLYLIVLSIKMFSFYYMDSINNMQYYFFLYFIFVGSMMILSFSANWFLILIAWDGLGVSSYLLVVYYLNPLALNSGLVTMMVNRLGDIFLLFFITTFSFLGQFGLMDKVFNQPGWIFFLLFCVFTKSAQFPFSSWLPMAMAAPTPISSLVHSSTLVTAGVFVSYRFETNMYFFCLALIFMASLWTSFYSGLMSVYEFDLKKMVALSTLSQISFMFLAFSLGLIFLSFLHLLVHASFKASLFFFWGL